MVAAHASPGLKGITTEAQRTQENGDGNSLLQSPFSRVLCASVVMHLSPGEALPPLRLRLPIFLLASRLQRGIDRCNPKTTTRS